LILDQFKLQMTVLLCYRASTVLAPRFAIALAEAGAQVACHGNTRSPATPARDRERGRWCHAITGDLVKPKRQSISSTQTLDRFGRIDILINNAGTIRRAPACDYSTTIGPR
jgi:2-deoxy-D-gluconate 3-dehydrogenase